MSSAAIPEGWTPADRPAAPEPGEVAVWACRTSLPAAVIDHLEATILSPAERARAGRFRFDRDRRAHVVGRSLLRRLLAEVHGVPATGLDLRDGDHGKPSLDPPLDGVGFNLSHSGALVLVALAPGRTVGVDVEVAKRPSPHDEIASRVMSPRELELYLDLDDAGREAAFYRLWSIKEAVVKATGRGLTFPVRELDVLATRRGPSGLPAFRREVVAEGRLWRVVELDPGAAAAVAYDGERVRPRLGWWSGESRAVD